MAYERSARPSSAPPRRRFGRRKVCRYCADKSQIIDFKDVTPQDRGDALFPRAMEIPSSSAMSPTVVPVPCPSIKSSSREEYPAR